MKHVVIEVLINEGIPQPLVGIAPAFDDKDRNRRNILVLGQDIFTVQQG
jgi:hypothetical protein